MDNSQLDVLIPSKTNCAETNNRFAFLPLESARPSSATFGLPLDRDLLTAFSYQTALTKRVVGRNHLIRVP
jgi:hypothetical protein